MDYERIQGPDFTLFIGLFSPGQLSHPPWGPEAFDCFIIDLGAQATNSSIHAVSVEVAGSATDWVETFGANAEAIHDAVDHASVELGRQARVGDGSPMTAWHSKLESLDSIVDYLCCGGHGACTIKVVLVLTSKEDVNRIATAIRKTI